jgi:hypothetical protein
MATTSVLPTSDERASTRRHQQSTPSRSQTNRSDTSEYGLPPRKPSSRPEPKYAPPPKSEYGVPARKVTSRHKALGESNNNDETVNVAAQSSRRSSSRDRAPESRAESSRSGHHHHRSSHSRDRMATTAANGGGPAPIVSAQESRPQGKSGKSRTTIPAPSGTFVLGKTVSKLLMLSGLEPRLPKLPNLASADSLFIADWSWING